MPLARWKGLCVDVVSAAPDGPEAVFWAAALGLRVAAHPARPDGPPRLVGELPTQTVWLNAVPEPQTVKNRVHLDVHVGAVADLESLGARALSAPAEFRWAVMADPEGQEFYAFERETVPAYRLYEIVVDTVDGAALAAWWQEVLGGELGRRDGDGFLTGLPGVPFEAIDFGNVPERKVIKNRVHWDVEVDGRAGLDALVSHGATLLREPDDEIHWYVLADPEGNEFCAFTG